MLSPGSDITCHRWLTTAELQFLPPSPYRVLPVCLSVSRFPSSHEDTSVQPHPENSKPRLCDDSVMTKKRCRDGNQGTGLLWELTYRESRSSRLDKASSHGINV